MSAIHSHKAEQLGVNTGSFNTSPVIPPFRRQAAASKHHLTKQSYRWPDLCVYFVQYTPQTHRYDGEAGLRFPAVSQPVRLAGLAFGLGTRHSQV